LAGFNRVKGSFNLKERIGQCLNISAVPAAKYFTQHGAEIIIVRIAEKGIIRDTMRKRNLRDEN